MTCKDCIHFQPTQLIQYDITDINFEHPEPLWIVLMQMIGAKKMMKLIHYVIIDLSPNKCFNLLVLCTLRPLNLFYERVQPICKVGWTAAFNIQPQRTKSGNLHKSMYSPWKIITYI